MSRDHHHEKADLPPVAPANPLRAALVRTARRTKDPAIRRWLLALARGESAGSDVFCRK
jgi:hypothetical protein